MGAGVSQLSQLNGNELLTHLSAENHLPPSDPFWTKLLAFHLAPPTSRDNQEVLETWTEVYLERLLTNNPVSGNIASLVQVFINRATELLASPNADNTLLSWQTLNALFVVRCVIKFLVENVSEEEIEQHISSCWEPQHNHGSEGSQRREEDVENGNTGVESASPKQDGPLEMLVDALFGLIIDVPVTESTYYLHLEAITTLLVVLGVQLYNPRYGTSTLSPLYRVVFGGRYSLHAALLVRVLLRDLSNTQPPPLPHHHSSGSIVLGIASSLWSLVSGGGGGGGTGEAVGVVNSQACLLLLVLANHANTAWPHNAYRAALLDWSEVGDIQQVYSALSSPPLVAKEHTTLLVYLLLHRNSNFRDYLLSRCGQDLHNLLVPIVKTLYDAPTTTSHHIYMSLIVLLILSEDDTFNKSIHQTMLKNVSWYMERSIQEISLGGLLVLVIVRTIQFNMLRCRDKYLHTNCLAALANMSGEFRNLNPYVAQRIVSLFEALSKKHTRLLARAHVPTPPTEGVEEGVEANEEMLTDEMRQEALQEVAALEEVLRMVLEIINSCLASQLRTNIHLVYSLLHKRALFHKYRTHRSLSDLIQNVEMVIGYFNVRLQRAQEQRGALGASQVLAVVTRTADHWSNDRLRKFPELKFRYVEEEQPEEFFTPYVWSLVSSLGVGSCEMPT